MALPQPGGGGEGEGQKPALRSRRRRRQRPTALQGCNGSAQRVGSGRPRWGARSLGAHATLEGARRRQVRVEGCRGLKQRRFRGGQRHRMRCRGRRSCCAVCQPRRRGGHCPCIPSTRGQHGVLGSRLRRIITRHNPPRAVQDARGSDVAVDQRPEGGSCRSRVGTRRVLRLQRHSRLPRRFVAQQQADFFLRRLRRGASGAQVTASARPADPDPSPRSGSDTVLIAPVRCTPGTPSERRPAPRSPLRGSECRQRCGRRAARRLEAGAPQIRFDSIR